MLIDPHPMPWPQRSPLPTPAPARQARPGRAAGERRAGPCHPVRMDAPAAERAFSLAVQAGLPMWFALEPHGEGGFIACRPRDVRLRGRWIEVSDGGLCLRLDEARIAQAWALHEPCAQGLVSTLACADVAGRTVAAAGCVAAPSSAEACAWRRLLDTLGDA